MGSFGEKIVIQKKMRLFSFFSFFFARAREEKEHSFLEESSSFVADRPRRV